MTVRATITRTLATTALVAGAAVATAPAASAESVWDRVAACESGGDWSINTGNGFYGGLQFHAQTWTGFGGGQYAPYAHQATRAQQIAIAQKVLAVQGPGAWPVCSVRAGLTADNGGVSAPAPAPAPTPAPRTQAPAPTPAPAPQAPIVQTPAPSVQRADLVSYTVRAGDTTSAVAATHGTTVAELVAINGLSDGGRLIFAGDTMLVPDAGPTGTTVRIAAGDTLAALALEHGTTVGRLGALNGLVDPDLIIAGELLTVR